MTEDPQGTPPDDAPSEDEPREEPGTEPLTDPPSAAAPSEDEPREEPGTEPLTDPPSALPPSEDEPPAEEATFGQDAVSGENALEAEAVPPAASEPAASAEDAVPGRLGPADTPADPAPAEALPVDPAPADAVPDASPDVALDPDVDTTAEASEQLEPEQARGFDPPADARDVVDARRGDAPQRSTDEAIPGAHLEPDLVLEDQPRPEDQFDRYEEGAPQTAATDPPPVPDGAPVRRTPLDLAADARYRATGKRKTSVARVILRPGSGAYLINGRTLDEFFPRPTLRRTARLPLETAGYETRMDVVARIHGGGVSSQAGALRHGIARALVEADPNLRTDLKRRGFLTRDARAKERKKAGLKKARKRPQFSKR